MKTAREIIARAAWECQRRKVDRFDDQADAILAALAAEGFSIVETGRCAIDGCDRKIHAQHLCNTHYQRSRRGTTISGEIPPVTPKGAAQRALKSVLEYDGEDCLLWPHKRGTNGYALIWNPGGTPLVHRIVCEHQNGPPPSADYQAAHSCGNGNMGCVARRHLSWKTPAGNYQDRVVHGTGAVGAQNGNARLSVDDVLNIRSLKEKISRQDIAKMYGITPNTVDGIQSGRKWASVPLSRSTREGKTG